MVYKRVVLRRTRSIKNIINTSFVHNTTVVKLLINWVAVSTFLCLRTNGYKKNQKMWMKSIVFFLWGRFNQLLPCFRASLVSVGDIFVDHQQKEINTRRTLVKWTLRKALTLSRVFFSLSLLIYHSYKKFATFFIYCLLSVWLF